MEDPIYVRKLERKFRVLSFEFGWLAVYIGKFLSQTTNRQNPKPKTLNFSKFAALLILHNGAKQEF